jgi:carbon monoxide dehydrogenase subunit G
MDDISYFESRSGQVTCSAEDVFGFVTDIRNFERFIPRGSVTNWQAERESCSFTVSLLGTVSFRITEKEMNKRVVYNGDALKKNDFSLVLNISGNNSNTVEVKVSLTADLNPMLKLMAVKPIGQFLEMLISGMESFRDWNDTKE